MAISYCSLSQASIEAKVGNTDGGFQAYYNSVYEQVTRRIEQETRNSFAPRIETRYYDGYDPDLRFNTLYLNAPLLSVTSIVLNGETTLLASEYDADSYNGLPAYEVYSDYWKFTSTRRRAIAITGIWGHRTYYTQDGWKAVTTLGAEISSTSATSITVASGASISVGDMLQVGSEWLAVISKSDTTLTVKRGIRGATASTHLNGASVSRWQPEPDIVKAASMVLSYSYARRGQFENVVFDAGGVQAVTLPDDLPKTVQNILHQYRLGYSKVV